MTFEELNLHPDILKAVRDKGYDTPTPIQRMAIPFAMEGRDVLGRAQTGTGKTAAFILPIIQRLLTTEGEGIRALILCPTRELAIQVAESARTYAGESDLFVGLLYGGTPVHKDIRDLRAGFDILVATPGRLIDHLERGNADLSHLEVLVLDEADRMLDMGFRPQINSILRHCPKERQTFFFSATLPNSVKSLAYESLDNPATVEVAVEAVTAEGVEQTIYSVNPRKKRELLVELLNRSGMDSVLVFTRTKAGADRVAKHLDKAGIDTAVMHGDRDMKQRVKALDAFAEGHARVLVATDVAQRGLDVEGISHVINYDVPQDPDSYVHRVGRTARAGGTGIAITFMSPGEIGDVRAIEMHIGQGLPRVELPGYGFGDVTEETVRMPTKPQPKTRGRRKLGRRSGDELSQDELDDLLKH